MALRPTLASLILHLALLILAIRIALPETTLPEPIPVSLISGARGGGGGDPGAASNAPVAPAAPPAPPPPVEPAPAVRPLPPAHKPAPRIAARAKPKAVPAPVRALPAPPAAAAPEAQASHEGAGSGAGSGTGTGSGSDSGSGSGSGGGVGRGGGADLRAFCLDCPEPHYPRLAVRRGWQGKVWIELALDAAGSVSGATVVRSSGFTLLDDAAVEVARQSRFRVADRRSGLLAYTFQITDTR